MTDVRQQLTEALDEAEIVQRVMARVFQRDGHWLWPGATNGKGYAKTTMGSRRTGRRTVALHRWMWERARGPIPGNLQIDHRCRTRNCINPDHLEVVTGTINRRRSLEANGVYEACTKGHPRSDFVTGEDGRKVICRACKRAERRARVARGVPANATHGTPTTYNLGCRCDGCRAGRRAYDQRLRARRAAAFWLGTPEVDHG